MKTRELRQKEAAERQTIYDRRTPQQQLAILDKKFGKGKGAKKERAKLKARIAAAQPKQPNRQKGKKHGDH